MEERFTYNWPGIIRLGAFMGVIFIVYSVLQYVFDLMTLSLYATSIIGFVSLIITFVCLWVFGNTYKKNYTGEVFSFGNAFVTVLMISVVSSLLLNVYNYVFNVFIDPDYMVNVMEDLRYKTEELYLNMGMDEDMIEEQLELFDQRADMPPFEQMWKGFAFGMIASTILSLIVAAIIRKKNPVFE